MVIKIEAATRFAQVLASNDEEFDHNVAAGGYPDDDSEFDESLFNVERADTDETAAPYHPRRRVMKMTRLTPMQIRMRKMHNKKTKMKRKRYEMRYNRTHKNQNKRREMRRATLHIKLKPRKAGYSYSY